MLIFTVTNMLVSEVENLSKEEKNGGKFRVEGKSKNNFCMKF